MSLKHTPLQVAKILYSAFKKNTWRFCSRFKWVDTYYAEIMNVFFCQVLCSISEQNEVIAYAISLILVIPDIYNCFVFSFFFKLLCILQSTLRCILLDPSEADLVRVMHILEINKWRLRETHNLLKVTHLVVEPEIKHFYLSSFPYLHTEHCPAIAFIKWEFGG